MKKNGNEKKMEKKKLKNKKKNKIKRAGTPTFGSAYAYSREPPTGNVFTGQNTRKKAGNLVAHMGTRGNLFGVT